MAEAYFLKKCHIDPNKDILYMLDDGGLYTIV